MRQSLQFWEMKQPIMKVLQEDRIYASPTNLGVGTDWQDEIFRIAPMDNFQVSARGGNDKSTYSISGNYFKQDGIVKNSDLRKEISG
jgi:hypothetical protein